jgi:hypothetical protein
MRSRALVAAALPVIVILAGCSTAPPDPYAAYRQTTVEVVPGTFDWQLHPVDEGFRPTISPEAAYAEVFEAGDRPDATAVLAQVGNAVEDTVGPPAWVFITPHMCFATAKGDLVSPAAGDGCTDENLYVQGVERRRARPRRLLGLRPTDSLATGACRTARARRGDDSPARRGSTGEPARVCDGDPTASARPRTPPPTRSPIGGCRHRAVPGNDGSANASAVAPSIGTR